MVGAARSMYDRSAVRASKDRRDNEQRDDRQRGRKRDDEQAATARVPVRQVDRCAGRHQSQG
jgi:hypothetical protein